MKLLMTLLSTLLISGFALVLPIAAQDTTSSPTVSPQQSPCEEEAKYRCPMHPEVTANEPGSCPKCNMALEKQMEDTEAQQGSEHEENMHE